MPRNTRSESVDMSNDIRCCPTCGEPAGSPDAGPCEGDHPCANRAYEQALQRSDAEYDADMAREVRIARGNAQDRSV